MLSVYCSPTLHTAWVKVCTRTTLQISATVQCTLWLYYSSLQASTCWQYHNKHYKVALQNELKGQVFISWPGTGKCHPCQPIPDELLLQILEDSHCKTPNTWEHYITCTREGAHMTHKSLSIALVKKPQGLPIGPAFHPSIWRSWELWGLHVGGDWAVDAHVHALLTLTARPQATNTCATIDYCWGNVICLRAAFSRK